MYALCLQDHVCTYIRKRHNKKYPYNWETFYRWNHGTSYSMDYWKSVCQSV